MKYCYCTANINCVKDEFSIYCMSRLIHFLFSLFNPNTNNQYVGPTLIDSPHHMHEMAGHDMTNMHYPLMWHPCMLRKKIGSG